MRPGAKSTTRAVVAGGAVAVAVFSATVGFAAAVGLTSSSLTVATVATTVPVQTCTPAVTDDTYAQQNSSNSNFGSATSVVVRSERLNRNKRAYIRFDISSCGIPSTARVKSATLSLVVTDAPGAARTHDVHRIAAASPMWTEGTLTWNTAASDLTIAASATASAAIGTSVGETISWSLASDVQSFVSGANANLGWRIADGTEGSRTAYEAMFSSSEHGTVAQRPVLRIEWYA